MKSMQKGFTLIELMIVVAIIAILAAIAIPAYQDYLIRSQVSEGASLADAAETAVAEFYSNTGRLPGSNQSAGLAAAASIKGKYVSQVDATGGIVRATFENGGGFVANAAINGQILAFSPVTGNSSGSIAWHCGSVALTTVTQKYLPASCRGNGQ
jgi:type IV pilus assembly protein PilA